MVVSIGGTKYAFWWKHVPPKGTGCFVSIGGRTDTCFEAVNVRVHPKDRFSKATGRIVSLTRLLQRLDLTRSARTIVWEAYWNRLPEDKRPHYRRTAGDEGRSDQAVSCGDGRPGEGLPGEGSG